MADQSTRMSAPMNVLVAGSGIAGLASAIAFAARGHDVTVLEQAEGLRTEGAGLQIGPNAVRALEGLGVWPALKAETVAPQVLQVRCGLSGRHLASVPLSENFQARFGAPYRVAHRRDLMTALAGHAHRFDNISLLTGEAVTAVETEQATVIARTRNDEFTGDLLIGADGVQSAVRRHLVPQSDARLAGFSLFRACPALGQAQASSARPEVSLWLLPGRHVVAYPVSASRRMNIVAVVPVGNGFSDWSVPATGARVQQAFCDGHEDLLALLASADDWQEWAALETPALPRWHGGPLTLVGDAAHTGLPFLAQGAAMALEDATELAGLCSRLPLALALPAYEKARKNRTTRALAAARRQGRIYHLSGPLRLARNAAMALLPDDFPLRRLDWLYKWQPTP